MTPSNFFPSPSFSGPLGGNATVVPLGSTFVLQLVAADSVGNDRTAGGDTVVAVLRGLATDVATERTMVGAGGDNDDGTYDLVFVAAHPGAFVLGATINGLSVEDNPTVRIGANCQPGTFALAVTGPCRPCTPGTYSEVVNAPSCDACPGIVLWWPVWVCL